jgi:hypothetical protein
MTLRQPNEQAVAARKSSRTREVSAACRGCDFHTVAANAQANAARHHDATGHTVDFNLELTVVYGDDVPPVPAGQTAFDDVGEAAAA